jgi:hypothetical protein
MFAVISFSIVCSGVFAPALLLRAVQPKIDHIERINSGGLNGILIHFGTEANFSYAVQYTTNLGGGDVPSGPWSNLYVTPNLTFANHYVIYDPGAATDKQRFYRLYAFQTP